MQTLIRPAAPAPRGRQPVAGAAGVTKPVTQEQRPVKRRTGFLAAVCLVASASVPAQSAEESASALVDAWASAFNQCSADKLASLYHADAALWGTNASTLITSPAGIRFYFDGACALQPPAKVLIGERTVKAFGSSAVVTGGYTFSRAGKDLPARFSFSLIKGEQGWLIVQHHSSLLPSRP